MVWTITVLLGFLIAWGALGLLIRYGNWIGEQLALTDLAPEIEAAVFASEPTLVRLDAIAAGMGYIDLLPHRDADGRTSIVAFVDVFGLLPSVRRKVAEVATAFDMEHEETIYCGNNAIRLKCGHDAARAARVCRDIFVKARNAHPGMRVRVRQRYLWGKQEA